MCVCVCVCLSVSLSVCLSVCLSVRTISAIASNKKNKRDTIRISTLWERFHSIQLFPVYTVSKVGHFFMSVNMHKGLRAFMRAMG